MWEDLEDSLGHDWASGDAGEHCVARSRYVPSSSPHARQRMQEQVYYLHCRDRQDAEDETRDLFTAGEIGTSRADARALLWDNRSIKGVCFHRLILSPSKGLGITTTEEAQRWTRSVMEGLGQRLDRDLTWVGAAHLNTGRLHVHLLVAGEGAQPSKTGARRVVRFTKSDLKAIEERLGVEAARPIREERQGREFNAARDRQAARLAALDQRLGVATGQVAHTALVGATPTPTTTPAPQAAPKRRWWQRGN